MGALHFINAPYKIAIALKIGEKMNVRQNLKDIGTINRPTVACVSVSVTHGFVDDH